MSETIPPISRYFGARINANRPTAELVIDRENSTILLDLEPVFDALLRDVCRSLARANRLMKLITIGRSSLLDPEHEPAMRAVLDILRDAGAMTIELGGSQADELAEELDEASIEPKVCLAHTCHWLVNPHISKDYCPAHENSL